MILNLFKSAENVRTSADQGSPGTHRDGQFEILNLGLVDKEGIHNPSYVQKFPNSKYEIQFWIQSDTIE